LEWVYAKGVVDPLRMTNLAKREREQLAAEMTFLSGDVRAHQLATDGTQKLLVQWGEGSDEGTTRRSDAGAAGAADGDTTQRRTGVGGLASGGDASVDPLAGTLAASLPVLNAAGSAIDYESGDPSRQTESVMIPTDDRKTACISSQVGCPVGCKFCASGLGGLDANLSAGRIVEQAYRLARLPEVGRISNVVFMGMGEPLANLRAVVHAVRTLSAPWGVGVSARKITVSTVGLPQAIRKLARELDLPVTLALSLHAPNDELRRKLIPWSEYTTIAELLDACDEWFAKTGREITLEYIMLGGVNDQTEHAEELAEVAARLRANVNLIRYNEVVGLPWRRPRSDDVHAFQRVLRERRINAHIRASRGRDIAAACGQLRHEAAAS
jgi:23S rRNA (adenine2503-C2)-methyltransferase